MLMFSKGISINFLFFIFLTAQSALSFAETYVIQPTAVDVYDEDGSFTLNWNVDEYVNAESRIELRWGGPKDFLNATQFGTYLSYWGNEIGMTQKSFYNMPVGINYFDVYVCYTGYDGWDSTPIDVCDPIRQIRVNVGNSSTGEGRSLSAGEYANNGSAQIYMGNDGKLDKLVVILQPYKKSTDWYPFDYFYNQFNQSNLLDSLRNLGYDVILYKYFDMSGGVAKAAQGVEVMLSRFNDSDFKSVKSISVIGTSMGGLVARYALLEQEKAGKKNKVTNWISFDAPHNGATVPQAIVDTLYKMKNDIDVSLCNQSLDCVFARAKIKAEIAELNSKTTSELLSNGPQDASPRYALYNQFANMGNFPKIPSFAISNGSTYAPQGYPTSNLVVKLTLSRSWPYNNVDHSVWSQPANENTAGGYEWYYEAFYNALVGQNNIKINNYNNQKHVFVRTESALAGYPGSSPFTRTITADNDVINEKHLQLTPKKSNEIINWIKQYQP